MTFFLNFRYDLRGGGLRDEPVGLLSNAQYVANPYPLQDLIRQLEGRDIVFLIHGYNNGQPEAVAKLARFAGQLGLVGNEIPVGLLWPGDSLIGFVSYPVEKPTATQTGRRLAAFLNSKLARVRSISFITHSLGARVALQAIRGLSVQAHAACLLAAAIERTCLDQEFADAFAKVDRLSLLCSMDDEVLKFAFPLGNAIGELLEPTANIATALGFSGPLRANGNTVPPWKIVPPDKFDHGTYLPSGAASAPPGTTESQKSADFARRALHGEPQPWPAVLPAARSPAMVWRR